MKHNLCLLSSKVVGHKTNNGGIAYKALLQANMPKDIAKRLVLQSQRDLIRKGVHAPSKKPWKPNWKP